MKGVRYGHIGNRLADRSLTSPVVPVAAVLFETSVHRLTRTGIVDKAQNDVTVRPSLQTAYQHIIIKRGGWA